MSYINRLWDKHTQRPSNLPNKVSAELLPSKVGLPAESSISHLLSGCVSENRPGACCATVVQFAALGVCWGLRSCDIFCGGFSSSFPAAGWNGWLMFKARFHPRLSPWASNPEIFTVSSLSRIKKGFFCFINCKLAALEFCGVLWSCAVLRVELCLLSFSVLNFKLNVFTYKHGVNVLCVHRNEWGSKEDAVGHSLGANGRIINT